MLDNENKNYRYTTRCLSDCPFVFLARPIDPGNGNIRIVMLEISKEQEKALDSGKSLSLERGGLSFSIDPNFCLAYGELDIAPNSEFVYNMSIGGWDKRLYIKIPVPSEYDYDTHTIKSDLPRGRWYDTANPCTYLPYLYACINKPERVCIFKEYTDTIAMIRARRKAEKQKEWSNNHKDVITKQRHKRSANKRKAKLSLLSFNLKR